MGMGKEIERGRKRERKVKYGVEWGQGT